MNDIKIKTESFPIRCEICHQSDLFYKEKNFCKRCNSLLNLKLIVKQLKFKNKPQIVIKVIYSILSSVFGGFSIAGMFLIFQPGIFQILGISHLNKYSFLAQEIMIVIWIMVGIFIGYKLYKVNEFSLFVKAIKIIVQIGIIGVLMWDSFGILFLLGNGDLFYNFKAIIPLSLIGGILGLCVGSILSLKVFFENPNLMLKK